MAGGPARESSPDGLRLPRGSRIRRTREIRALFGRGKRKRTDHLDVFFAASPASRPRWGTVVPKHGHTIAERNLLRRRLREIGRRSVLPELWRAKKDIDVMVRARREAYDASYQVLAEEMDRVTEALCSDASSSD